MTTNMGSNLAGKSTRSGEILAAKLAAEGIKNPRVLQAIAQTPRHHFLPEILAHKAYENTALPIGQGQTISQPYIVAKMTELLIESGPVDKVLEIGTGSGYQTAVLTSLVKHVYSVERIKSLQFQAKRKLQQIDRHNVSMKHGDGWQGWQSKAPFDAIIVTAAPSEVPSALISQLVDGGRLVIPVGGESQILQIITRNGDSLDVKKVEAVKFVPLVPGGLL